MSIICFSICWNRHLTGIPTYGYA